MSSITNFGVIGTGRMARRLVSTLQSTDGVTVSSIASRLPERARWFADQNGVASAEVGYDAVLKRDDIDAVYIALPPSLHAEWTIAAAEHKKHVLCEKPLAIDFRQASQAVTAANAAGVRLLCGSAWMHHPRTTELTQMLADNRFGNLSHISTAVSLNQPFQSQDHRLDPSLGGGCILDLAWHGMSLTRLATGALPIRVFADALMAPEGIASRVTVMLWFADDITATISAGYDAATRKWCEIAGSDAAYVCDDFTRPWPDRPARCWVHEGCGKVQQLTFEGDQDRCMVQALVGDESLESWHNQCLDTQRIADAIGESIESGGPVRVGDTV